MCTYMRCRLLTQSVYDLKLLLWLFRCPQSVSFTPAPFAFHHRGTTRQRGNVRTDRSQLHVSSSRGPGRAAVRFWFPSKSISRSSRQKGAGMECMWVCMMALILASCHVFINRFSPFCHVSRRYCASNYIHKQLGITILWQSPTDWGLTCNLSPGLKRHGAHCS